MNMRFITSVPAVVDRACLYKTHEVVSAHEALEPTHHREIVEHQRSLLAKPITDNYFDNDSGEHYVCLLPSYATCYHILITGNVLFSKSNTSILILSSFLSSL